MRPSVKWLLTAALALVMAAPALGQILSGMMPLLENGLDTPILLANKDVQKEIKLTDDQGDRIRKIVREVHDKYQNDLRKARLDREPKKLVKLIADSTQETRDRVNEALPDILKPDQLKRLKQIQLQANGLLSFNRPEVQKELKLTDKQKDDIQKIGDGLRQDMAEVVKDAARAPLRKGREAVHKVDELKGAATKKALAVLTDEQRKSWDEMTGEKFDLRLDILPSPGGR